MKQVYKLKLLKKQRIYNVFYILMLKHNISKKKQVDKNIIRLNFKVNNSKKYKVEAI